MLRSLGLDARKTAYTGRRGTEDAPDVSVVVPGLGTLNVEVKLRKDARGFRQVQTWLDHNFADLLVLKADREDPLVALAWDTFEKIVDALKARFADDRNGDEEE